MKRAGDLHNVMSNDVNNVTCQFFKFGADLASGK